ncbi:MAG TPA: hypothetical protein VK993_01750 [Chthoniobacterales bacterium]|nr:hypothetical protein [Chthoniobacterales bacterium]
MELAQPGSSPGEGTLANGTPGNYSSYLDVPPVKQRVAMFKRGDRSTPFGLFDLPFEPDRFLTVLVHGDPRRPKVELVDDTTIAADAPGVLRVWNFFPGATVNVSASQQSSGSVPYNGYAVISGLPRSTISAKLEGKLPNNTPVQAEVELGFGASAQRATLLILPDSYGRFRPRVAIDGANF